ncbi:hypothetical protein AWV80_38435 [Cupriavidus sp. UYMU48A]|nr:hypothetical protein AWV80_38435 [Cupriavidus sp. UYMU48A]
MGFAYGRGRIGYDVRAARSHDPGAPAIAGKVARAGSLRRKLKKLTKNPVMFFRDSTIGLFRMVGNRMIRD